MDSYLLPLVIQADYWLLYQNICLHQNNFLSLIWNFVTNYEMKKLLYVFQNWVALFMDHGDYTIDNFH